MFCEDGGIDELHGDDVARGICGEELAHIALESAHGGAVVEHGILVVVHRELEDEKIDRTFRQDVLGEAESPGHRTGRSEARVGDGDLGLGPALAQARGQQMGMSLPALGDRTAEKGDVGTFFPLDLGEEVADAPVHLHRGGILRGEDRGDQDEGGKKEAVHAEGRSRRPFPLPSAD